MNPFDPNSETQDLIDNFGGGVVGEVTAFGPFLPPDLRTNVIFPSFQDAVEYLTDSFNLLPISTIWYDEDDNVYYVSIPDVTQ